jgi:hypothetical protein
MYTIQTQEMRELIKEFSSDKDGLMCYWHHSQECMHMFDTEDQIQRAKATYEKQGFSYRFTKKKDSYDLLVFQKEDEDDEPVVDPLASGVGFIVSGTVMIVKHVCWQCRVTTDINYCPACKISVCCNKKECREKHVCCPVIPPGNTNPSSNNTNSAHCI